MVSGTLFINDFGGLCTGSVAPVTFIPAVPAVAGGTPARGSGTSGSFGRGLHTEYIEQAVRVLIWEHEDAYPHCVYLSRFSRGL